jgi:hypothetical protein
MVRIYILITYSTCYFTYFFCIFCILNIRQHIVHIILHILHLKFEFTFFYIFSRCILRPLAYYCILQECALIFSKKGDTSMSVALRHVFLGIIFDTTHLVQVFVTVEKFSTLMVLLCKNMDLVTCSPRGMMRLRDKVQHQRRCTNGVRPFLVHFD